MTCWLHLKNRKTEKQKKLIQTKTFPLTISICRRILSLPLWIWWWNERISFGKLRVILIKWILNQIIWTIYSEMVKWTIRWTDDKFACVGVSVRLIPTSIWRPAVWIWTGAEQIFCISHSLTMAVMWKVNGQQSAQPKRKAYKQIWLMYVCHAHESTLVCESQHRKLAQFVLFPSATLNIFRVSIGVMPDAKPSNLLNFTERWAVFMLSAWPKTYQTKVTYWVSLEHFQNESRAEPEQKKNNGKNCLQHKLWICFTVILFGRVRISWLFLRSYWSIRLAHPELFKMFQMFQMFKMFDATFSLHLQFCFCPFHWNLVLIRSMYSVCVCIYYKNQSCI